MLTGWKTVLFNIGVAISIPALNVLVGVNWVDLVGPTYAVAVVAAVNIALRYVTNSPIFNRGEK